MHTAFAIIVFISGLVINILSVGGIIGTTHSLIFDSSPLIIFGFSSSCFGLVCSFLIICLSKKLAMIAESQSSQASRSSPTPRAPASNPVQPSNTISILIQHPSGHLELGTATLERDVKCQKQQIQAV